MCGRYTLTIDLEALFDVYPFSIEELDYGPRYNIAPTQQVLTYGAQGPNTAEYMRWGLIPVWKKPDQKLPLAVNARAETVATGGMFRVPFRRQRCLVLADGFYEWKAEGTTKVPYRIGVKDWRPFGFAGLWDEWHDPDTGESKHSCTIITTSPNALMEPIHNRMPVILPRDAEAAWLDLDNPTGEGLADLLVPYPADEMEAYKVSTLVNSTKNAAPDVVAPAS